MRTSGAADSVGAPTGAITVSAPAKVNLYLGIHAEHDERGYHRVDSVMAALDLADTLTIEPAAALEVLLDPPAAFPMEKNTAYRAAVALAHAFGREPGARIVITKRIPLQAGLGGPSTDAAAALLGLCALWGIDARDERVEAVARSIGADVPFFLHGALAYLDGAGDRLRERFEPLAGMPVVLVQPEGVGVSAGAAYARFDADPTPLPPLEPMLSALRAHDEEAVCAALANNLAPASCALAPQILGVLAWLREQEGVRAALMSGSGACSFALCSSADAARAIARAAQERRGWWACATSMKKSGAAVIER